MGYRYAMKDVNMIANLACGRVDACYAWLVEEEKNLLIFDNFLNNFSWNMYTGRPEQLAEAINRLKRAFSEIYDGYYRVFQNQTKPDGSWWQEREARVKAILDQASDIMCECKVKSLLLPALHNNRDHFENFMLSERVLRELVKIHPDTSCLILQVQEAPDPRNISVFDAFPHFNIALRNVEQWPAVLFWDDEGNSAFVPVSNEDELKRVYRLVDGSEAALPKIREYAATKAQKQHYYMHISDLHFGAKDAVFSAFRLQQLLENQMSSMGAEDVVDFVITGDAMDSPKRENADIFLLFSRLLQLLSKSSHRRPIFVYGNHDVNRKGLAFRKTKQELVSFYGEYPRLEVDEEQKIVFLLFNSNTNGMLAQGMIGSRQMAKMANLLDERPELEDYAKIAVLHHHVVPISGLPFLRHEWYKKLIPKGVLSASLELVDAGLFLEWLNRRGVKLVMHGHMHIPDIKKVGDINIISCGSSTGQVEHVDKDKTYISYNELKIKNNTVTCVLYAEEIMGAGAVDIRTEILPLK